MKIGILTFHRALNYGAVLQCYALQEVLKSLGHQVEVIDYRPDYLEKYRRLISFYSIRRTKGFTGKLKMLLGKFILMPQILRTRRAFDSFISCFLRLSNIVGKTDVLVKDYDVIVFGSDQIWSPSICEGLDNIYWGNFQHEGIRMITYAASMGGHNVISDEQWTLINKYINNYDSISVREKNLKQELKKNCNKESVIVLDPTLLAPPSIFNAIATKPPIDNYVLLFTLEKEEKAVPFAQNIANQLGGIPVIKLCALRSVSDRIDGVEYVCNVSPTEFLGYFKYAKCVVTISFHGTAFSTIFNKDFYCLKSSQMDRAKNLLQSLELEDRIVSPTDTVLFKSIDYVRKEVLQKEEEQRKISMNYLKNSLR